MERRFEAIFGSPLRLVLLVALVIGLPVIGLGEAAAADARSRAAQAETTSAALATQRAAGAISERIKTLKAQITAVTRPAVTDKLPPLVLAVNSGDRTGAESELAALRALVGPELPTGSVSSSVWYVLDPRSRVLVVDPPGYTQIGTDLTTRPYGVIGLTSVSSPLVLTPAFLGGVSELYRLGAVSTGSGAAALDLYFGVVGALGGPAPGNTLTVLASARQMVSDTIQSLRPGADEVYVVDGSGRLIVRATPNFSPDDALLRDLASDPLVSGALTNALAGAHFDDPFGRGSRLAASALVPELGWRVISLAQPSIATAELDSTLGQQRVVRVVLVALLLAGSLVLARTVRRTLSQGRALADASVRIARANEAKSQFLANMSHELRTPLKAVIGFADVLSQGMAGDLNAKQAE